MFPEQNQSPFGYKPMDQTQMYGPFTDALTRQPAQQTPAQPSGYGGKKEALAMFASKLMEGAQAGRRQAFERSEQTKMEQARNLDRTYQAIESGPFTTEAKQKAFEIWTKATAGRAQQELEGVDQSGSGGQGQRRGGGQQKQEHPAVALAKHFLGGILGPTENREHLDHHQSLNALANIVYDPSNHLDPSKFTQAGLEAIAGTPSGQQGSPGQFGTTPQTVTMPGTGPTAGNQVTLQPPTVTGQTPSAPVTRSDIDANPAWQKNLVASQREGYNLLNDPAIAARLAPLDPEKQQQLALVNAQIADFQAQRDLRTKPQQATVEIMGADGQSPQYAGIIIDPDGVTRRSADGKPLPEGDPRATARVIEKGEVVGYNRDAARSREIAERAQFQQDLEGIRQRGRETIRRITELGLNTRSGANNTIKADIAVYGQFDKLLASRGQVADKITHNPADRTRLEADLKILDQQIEAQRPAAEEALERLQGAAENGETKKPPTKAAGTPNPATGGGGSIRDRLDRAAFGGAPAPVAQGSATAPTHRYTGGDQISPVQ